ncbi:hypothetical protein [Salicibibacter kimchii]|nr:hypothetical protein [Salicibibacter kimchii]
MNVQLIPGEQLKNGKLRPTAMKATKDIIERKIKSGEYKRDRDRVTV